MAAITRSRTELAAVWPPNAEVAGEVGHRRQSPLRVIREKCLDFFGWQFCRGPPVARRFPARSGRSGQGRRAARQVKNPPSGARGPARRTALAEAVGGGVHEAHLWLGAGINVVASLARSARGLDRQRRPRPPASGGSCPTAGPCGRRRGDRHQPPRRRLATRCSTIPDPRLRQFLETKESEQ